MLGRGLLGVAITLAAYALVAAPASMRRERGAWRVARPDLLDSARRALIAVSVAVALAAGRLWYAFFTRDFSIAYVAANTSRSASPWYTFSALWAGMAGSLLLWSLILSVYAALFAGRRAPEREPFVPWAVPVLAGAELFYLTVTAVLANPFAASDVVPFDGRGMNPLLHSPGMLIHPPMLYTGLIGMIVPFAIVVSGLVQPTTGAGWVRVLRRWTLLPWLALGSGLVLGGAWAYTELGWGGYWGWDPVENAALMPWLVATAFLHSAMVQERRGMLKVWNVFLVTTAASLATFGAFLTRSGLLSSVHTFAESPVGRWFFVFLAVQAVGGVALILWRLPHLRSSDALSSAVSKEAAFLLNNLMFVGAAAVVLWGTVLPLASEAVTGEQLAVGPTFFNRVLSPIGAMILLLSSFGTVVPWRRGSASRVVRRLGWPAAIAAAASVPALVASRSGGFAGLVAIAALLGSTSVLEVARAARARAAIGSTSIVRSLPRTLASNPRRYGGYVVHLGVAIMLVGFAGSLGRTQTEISASPGERFSFAGYTFVYDELERFAAPDKDVNLAVVQLSRGGKHLATLRPQLNFHRNWDQPQSELAIRTTPVSDVYMILAGVDPSSDRAVFRIHHNPLVLWVWAGAGVALLGGIASMLLGRPRSAILAREVTVGLTSTGDRTAPVGPAR